PSERAFQSSLPKSNNLGGAFKFTLTQATVPETCVLSHRDRDHFFPSLLLSLVRLRLTTQGPMIEILPRLLPGPRRVPLTNRSLGAPSTLSGNLTTTWVTSLGPTTGPTNSTWSGYGVP